MTPLELKKQQVREYLTDIKNKQDAIDDRLDRYLRLRSKMEYGGVNYAERVQGGAPTDMLDSIAMIDEALNRWIEDTALYIEDIEECLRICEPMECRMVFESVVKRLTVTELANKYHYSARVIIRMKNEGVEIIYQRMPAHYRALPKAV